MQIGIDARLWMETGVGRYIRNLVAGLVQVDTKNTYTFFIRSNDLGSIKKTLGPSAANCRFVVSDIRWHTLSEQVRFARIINQSDVDLVHFPYFSLPLLTKKPYVVTIHDVIIHHFPTGKASTLPLPLYRLKHTGYRYVVSQAGRRARTILVPLSATKAEVVKALGVPSSKVVVTEEGVDPAIVPTKTARENVEHLLRGNKHFFLYVGNAYPHKNLPRLLEAFAMYQAQYPQMEAVLTLVGKPDYFYKKLKKLNMPSVLFLTNIQDAELAVLYQKTKALLVPSLMEGFGLPALEAMANGCLVLASQIPSLKEVCGDSALYFDPYKTEEIAKSFAAVDALSQKKADMLRRKGKEKARGYSWERMVRQTITAYESSLGVRPGQ